VTITNRTPQEQHLVALARWLLIAIFLVIGYMVVEWAARILGPILAALGIAYLLAPVAARLQRAGMSRTAAAGLLLLAFVAVVVMALIVLVPRLIQDASDLIADLPRIVDNLSAWLHNHFGIEIPADWRTDLRAYLQSEQLRSALFDAAGPVGELATEAVSRLLNALAIVGETLLIPVFAFYFLADWDGLLSKLKHLVPPRSRAAVTETAIEIDRVIAGWVRGQGIVVMILAILYGTAFQLIGVPGGLVLGFVVGVLTVVPFVGTIVGAGLTFAIILAGGASTSVAIETAITFGVLHLLEAAVLTPKIVGHRVGLSESAALFAVVAGGKLLGFVGIVLAVPLAATVAVLLRKLVAYYEHTAFFGNESDANVAVPTVMSVIMPGAPSVKSASHVESPPAETKVPSSDEST
jgi:predicted PurR-regulated permease PerM